MFARRTSPRRNVKLGFDHLDERAVPTTFVLGAVRPGAAAVQQFRQNAIAAMNRQFQALAYLRAQAALGHSGGVIFSGPGNHGVYMAPGGNGSIIARAIVGGGGSTGSTPVFSGPGNHGVYIVPGGSNGFIARGSTGGNLQTGGGIQANGGGGGTTPVFSGPGNHGSYVFPGGNNGFIAR